MGGCPFRFVPERDSFIVYIASISRDVTGVLISPKPDPTKKTVERSPFFVRRGGHCCRGELFGPTTF